jgi:hypothetical protein
MDLLNFDDADIGASMEEYVQRTSRELHLADTRQEHELLPKAYWDLKFHGDKDYAEVGKPHKPKCVPTSSDYNVICHEAPRRA